MYIYAVYIFEHHKYLWIFMNTWLPLTFLAFFAFESVPLLARKTMIFRRQAWWKLVTVATTRPVHFQWFKSGANRTKRYKKIQKAKNKKRWSHLNVRSFWFWWDATNSSTISCLMMSPDVSRYALSTSSWCGVGIAPLPPRLATFSTHR